MPTKADQVQNLHPLQLRLVGGPVNTHNFVLQSLPSHSSVSVISGLSKFHPSPGIGLAYVLMYVVFLGPEVGGNLCAGEGGLHEGERPWGEAESHSGGYRLQEQS